MKKPLMIAAAVAAFSGSTAIAGAGSYTGNWPLTITRSQGTNRTFCLEVTDDGGSGLAYLEIDGQALYGTFKLVGHTIVVTDESQGGEGQNAGLVFTAHAAHGSLGTGVYDDVIDGESSDTGKVVFGKKGGC
jgi:hypothetical protein